MLPKINEITRTIASRTLISEFDKMEGFKETCGRSVRQGQEARAAYYVNTTEVLGEIVRSIRHQHTS